MFSMVCQQCSLGLDNNVRLVDTIQQLGRFPICASTMDPSLITQTIQEGEGESCSPYYQYLATFL